MNSTVEALLFVLIGFVAAALIGVVIYFVTKKKPATEAEATVVDQQALQQAADALLDRAKVEAKSADDMQKIADIEKIEDPAAKLKALSDALKSV